MTHTVCGDAPSNVVWELLKLSPGKEPFWSVDLVVGPHLMGALKVQHDLGTLRNVVPAQSRVHVRYPSDDRDDGVLSKRLS